eukprot:9809305-Prorocentrum_lima.AAC.1
MDDATLSPNIRCMRCGVSCPAMIKEEERQDRPTMAVAGSTCVDFSLCGKRMGLLGKHVVVW